MKSILAGSIVVFGLLLTAVLALQKTIPGEVFIVMTSASVSAAVTFLFEERRIDKIGK